MSSVKTIRDLDVANKRALVRVDFNVPQDTNGNITDDTRIIASIPTISYLLDKGATVILMSHLGRPKGKDAKYSLKPCADRLSKLLGKKVLFLSDCVGNEVEQAIKNAAPGSVILLENLRFYPAEEDPKKDPSFAENLSRLGDFYINDAFGSAHRAHSSTCTIAQYFPINKGMGLLMEKEVSFLQKTFNNPKRPFMAIIGGAKVSTKIGILKSLLEKADILFIGGAMAYTFLKAQGKKIGKSLCEDEFITNAVEILDLAKKMHKPIFLPIDLVISNSLKEDRTVKVIDIEAGIPDDFEGVDIGPRTCGAWEAEFNMSKTLFWNGPVGIFEIPEFARGTRFIAEAISSLPEVTTIVGGGDSVAALEQLKLTNGITHISTGGGASLELIELGTLPGITALAC